MNTVHPSSVGDHPFIPTSRNSRPLLATGRPPLDATALARPAAVVRHRRHILDPGDLEARGGERTDRGLSARTRALHEHIHPLESVLLRGPGCLLGGELRGERGGLPGPFEAHVPGARPAERVPLLVGDRDDRVVERRLDMGLPVQDVLLLSTLRLLRLGLGHAVRAPFRLLLLRDLLLAGDRLLRSLAGPGVRVGPLAADRKRPTVPDALVAPDLDLALDVLRDLPTKVTFDLEVPVDELADLEHFFLGEIADLGAALDRGPAHDLKGAGRTDAVDVSERDIEPLVPREINAGDPCHVRRAPLSSLAAACAVGWSRSRGSAHADGRRGSGRRSSSPMV